MSYQVLARKWRPQTFSDVVGQEHVLTALTNGLSLGRIHHAYLLSGTRGVGKTTIARLLAKGLNCENGITANPCGVCDNCREIEQGRFVDLIEIDAASRTKVEDTRDLLDNVQYAPARGRFKVYLIDEVHMLSRHSFNALLKTLEEPPSHVKFLLATTDPQKLPVTILSRCLQFHLKALDVGQIRGQLERILLAENIVSEPRALQLLARAADGSMRDALSLTDQAIAMGQGQVTTSTVTDMLGTLDTEQPLALIEALVKADGNALLAQLSQCASRGVDWDTLLVEMLSLLHHIAMEQLSSDALAEEDAASVSRLRQLARQIPPADLQLYYQILLVGRKELPFAPDRRMGVEMTLLRGLAFHPQNRDFTSFYSPAAEKKTADNAFVSTPQQISGLTGPAPEDSHTADNGYQQTVAGGANAVAAASTSSALRHNAAPIPAHPHHPSMPTPSRADLQDGPIGREPESRQFGEDPAWAAGSRPMAEHESTAEARQPAGGDRAVATTADTVPDATAQLLQARSALRRHSEGQKPKKAESASLPRRQNSVGSPLERLASVSEQAQQRQVDRSQPAQPDQHAKPEAYRWRASGPADISEPVTTPKALRTALEHEKTPELAARLAEEAIERDHWAALVHRLTIPKLVQQLALNAFREELAPGKVCLHLRSTQQHLNSAVSQAALTEALSAEFGAPVELTVVTDDNPAVRTPLEWRQAIYEEKLMQARQAIIADTNIQTLRRFFDAELDEDSIRPV